MAKFEETFCEPCFFDDCSYVLSRYYSREEAAQIFSEYLGEPVPEESLEKDHVRFGFYTDEMGERIQCWQTGVRSGKGAKPVWVVGA